ncbi:MAG: glycosyltransferase [Sphingobacteriales bacterium]|nr:MAG: glycosyltransferase [Sphingobacteriales bacterium]
MIPKLSVIIPCYNQGYFLEECIESIIKLLEEGLMEIIIINDGSTDDTPLYLNKVEELYPAIRIINQENKGLANARNEGIKMAQGVYILPLDADNKVKPDYILKAIEVLDTNKADIVYAKPLFFGEDIAWRKFNTHAFDASQLMMGNYIDACAIYKKSVWEKNNGYDSQMPYHGVEDWEFWVHSIKNGFRFYFIDEELYYYRIVGNSMITQTVELDKGNQNFTYIVHKHSELYIQLINELNYYKERVKFEENNPLRTSIKYFLRFIKGK